MIIVQQPGLQGRQRDKNGEISRKHGNTLVRILRKTCGQGFAPGAFETEKLRNGLVDVEEPSLSQLDHDHEHGHLEGKIAQHEATPSS